jgi:type IV secretory pathway TrbD component
MFAALLVGARWITATDPQLLRIVLNSARFRTHYDPAKLAYFRRGARR